MSATSGLTALHDAHCAAPSVRHHVAARKLWRSELARKQGYGTASPINAGGPGGFYGLPQTLASLHHGQYLGKRIGHKPIVVSDFHTVKIVSNHTKSSWYVFELK